jgi:hypothetical protein
MGNLIRLKQVDKPEFSGYIEQIGDLKYYLESNPSGFLSSISGDSHFLELSGDVFALSGDLSSNLTTTGQTLSSDLDSTGQTLSSKTNALSGYVESSNANIVTVSGDVNTALNTSTGYAFSVGTDLSGDVSSLSGYVTTEDSSLNSKITSTSGTLSSRISSLEGVFSNSGSSFVDLVSNNQTISGQKNFDSRTNFKLINIVPVTGDYINPGGLNNYFYTQFSDDATFFVSGVSGFQTGGYMTGDIFVNKMVFPDGNECIISSNIYTGTY